MLPRPVRLLPPEIIHRIAAGEVVDRPASALKEVLENSLDAGARRLRVTITDGGLRSIEVEDDGCGLSRADLEVCLQRHATSKISALEDLDAILSLGFRGEALSAISSVSQLSIETFREGEPHAWKLQVSGGLQQEIRPAQRRRGTLVKIEDLFFNVPARRKFLKKAGSEAQECVDTLEALALAHPEVAFEWYVVDAKGEVREQTALSPSPSLAQRFAELCPAKGELLHILSEPRAEGVAKVEIALIKPPASGRGQKAIRLSVNGRAVQDKRLPYALRDAFTGLIEVGHFPHAYIRLEVDPAVIDVNIHPQKKEIRWPSGFSLAGIVYSLVRPHFTVSSASPLPPVFQQDFRFNGDQIPEFTSPTLAATMDLPAPAQGGMQMHPTYTGPSEISSFVPTVLSSSPAPQTFSLPQASQSPRPPFRFASLRVVGEVGAAWIVCESDKGLVLIDQHAAHERINFERILKKTDLIRSKPLLLPLRLKLPHSLDDSEAELLSCLESLGFEFADRELSKPGEIEFIAVPEADRKVSWEDLLQDAFDEISKGEKGSELRAKLETRIAASLACHGSVRRGQRLAADQIIQLLKDMDSVEWGGLCPHGRPLWFELAHDSIEALFHR
jgi:DNA mismatch repair protein MutL